MSSCGNTSLSAGYLLQRTLSSDSHLDRDKYFIVHETPSADLWMCQHIYSLHYMVFRKRWTILYLLDFTNSLEGSYFETPRTLKPIHINPELCREPVKILNTLNHSN
jgi:hypothetical protein